LGKKLKKNATNWKRLNDELGGASNSILTGLKRGCFISIEAAAAHRALICRESTRDREQASSSRRESQKVNNYKGNVQSDKTKHSTRTKTNYRLHNGSQNSSKPSHIKKRLPSERTCGIWYGGLGLLCR
jgi:hypothetical protein